MSISEHDLERIFAEVEDNAQRAQDRGLEHGTTADIVQAQLALGAKRAVAEIRRRVGYLETVPLIVPSRSHRSHG